MAITRRPTKHGENALSEVIGFIIIFGIIVLLFSNYMLYGIPAQGRDNEIAHMNDVKDQFVDYKVGLDALFNNNKVGTTISNSFTLGTEGSYTSGANSIIPIINPIRSSGTIAINERELENLTIVSESRIESESNSLPNILTSSPQPVNYTPSHIYVSVSVISGFNLSLAGIYGATINGTNWKAIVNITPQNMTYTKWSSLEISRSACETNYPGSAYIPSAGVCLVPLEDSRYGSISELQLSVSKNNVFTMKNYAIYDAITPGTTYTLDLMDEAYGLNSFIVPPDTISLKTDKPLTGVTASGNFTYRFSETGAAYYNATIPLGSLEYRAQNNYWISQNYYYQLGGIFVTQADGSSTYKLPPEITFSNDSATNIVTVNINALAIDQSSRGIVGGNSPVQIKTTLKSNNALPYVSGTANTKWIRIGITTSDSKALEMWKNYFNYSAMADGIPHTLSGNTNSESYIFINGSDKMGDTYDINVIASNATFSTIVHGIGGTYT